MIKKAIACIETLESRIAPATFTVINNNDAGVGSLRQAILDANNAMGVDLIDFNMAGSTTVSLVTDLPSVTEAVTIDGSTQMSNPIITTSVSGTYGLFVTANDVVVDSLVITGFTYGLVFSTVDGGSVARGAYTGNTHGITVDGCNDVHVGGSLSTEATVVSGNTNGVLVSASTNITITGLLVGTLADGLTPNPNSRAGIEINGGANTVTIGGTTADDRNIISGNTLAGILIGDSMENVQIFGNYIGVGLDGTTALGNTVGIHASIASHVVIGNATAPNLIANNVTAGIEVDPAASGVTVARNDFKSNGSTINLFPLVSASINDVGDFDTGANNLQNFPVLVGASPSLMMGYDVFGSLDSQPLQSYTLDFYAFDSTTGFDQHVGSGVVITDGLGHADFTTNIGNPGAATQIHATATAALSGDTSEMSDLAVIGPRIDFSNSIGSTSLEGNSGSTLVNFTVTLNSVPSGQVTVKATALFTSTATEGTDFVIVSNLLSFDAMTLSQDVVVSITGDASVEPDELVHLVLSDVTGAAVLVGSTSHLTITNDDTSLIVSTDGKTATWRDVDGDLVTLKATKGVLDPLDFTLKATNTLGGEVLQTLDLSSETLADLVNLTFTAKPDRTLGGDGSVHLGYLNAANVDLGTVKLPGDLGRITVGDSTLTDPAIKALSVGSMGVFGINTQEAGGSLSSSFLGKVGKLTVTGDIREAYLSSGVGMGTDGSQAGFGPITIGGDLVGGSALLSGVISTTGDIASIKIAGDFFNSGGLSSSSITALGKIGAVTVGGKMRGTGLFSALLNAGGAIGKISVGGLDHAAIFAGGTPNPAKASAAVAIAALTVKGGVIDSSIIVGPGFSTMNPDAQIGAISVGGDWVRSVASAGVSAGMDFLYATSDDALLTPSMGLSDNPAIVSKIASITIKGHVIGDGDSTHHYGFVAQQIGAFKRGLTKYTLSASPVVQDGLIVGSIFNNVRLLEVV